MANEFIARKGLIALNNSQVTGSLNVSGSLSITGISNVSASIAAASGGGSDFPYTGSAIISGSLEVIGKVTGSVLIEGSGSTLFEVVGSEGQLFSITDSLSGSLFAVSDVSGLPILEVFSDDTVKIGSFNNEAITISGSHTTIGGVLAIPGFSNVSASLAAAVAGGDDLGNHTATQDLNMGGNAITNVGNVDGVDVSTLKSDFDTLEGKTLVSSSAQIDHDATTNFNAAEHFTQANITTVGTVTSGDVSAILPSGTVSSSAQITITESQISDLDHYTDSDVKTKLNTENVVSGSATQVRSFLNVEDGADVTDTANVTAAGALMDSEVDADIKTLSLPANTTISTFGASLIDDTTAAAARTTLGVDASGTDNSTDVTLVTTSHDYLSIAGQAITLGTIDISDDTNLVAGGGISLTGDTLSVAAGTGLTQGATGLSFDADGGTLTTNNADVDHILINDGGTFKRITKGNINVGDFNNNVGYLTTVDISTDTNLVGGTNLTLSGDTMNLDANISLTSITASGNISASYYYGTPLVGPNEYAFRYTNGGTIFNTGLFFSQTNGQYEFLNGSSTCVFCIKAGSGNTTIYGNLTASSDVDIQGTLSLPGIADVSASLASAGGGGGGISNIVEDTTPQLGGNLDVNGYSFTGANNSTVTVGNYPVGYDQISFSGYYITGSGLIVSGAQGSNYHNFLKIGQTEMIDVVTGVTNNLFLIHNVDDFAISSGSDGGNITTNNLLFRHSGDSYTFYRDGSTAFQHTNTDVLTFSSDKTTFESNYTYFKAPGQNVGNTSYLLVTNGDPTIFPTAELKSIPDSNALAYLGGALTASAINVNGIVSASGGADNYFGGRIIQDNNVYITGKETGGSARNILGINNSDEIQVGNNNLDTVIKGTSITLNNNTEVIGTLRISGITDVSASIAAASSGGGGSSTLSGLSDVNITSIADGDLLRYNGTATEWQNTNLGLSLTPTISSIEGGYFGGYAKITNWGSYTQPSAQASVVSGSAETLIATCDVSSNGEITWDDSNTTTGERILKVQVQDFGDLASEITTGSYTKSSASYRYFRWYAVSASSNVQIDEFRFYTSENQGGTKYPPNMTSNTAPSPYVAASSGNYSGYLPYEAFDSLTYSEWWNLSSPPYQGAYLSIDLGSAQTIKSMRITHGGNYQSFTVANIQGSSDNTNWDTIHTYTNDPNNPNTSIRNFG